MTRPVDCVGKLIEIGDRVRARPPIGPYFEGIVLRHRPDPRKGKGMGWLDIRTSKGDKSARPTVCAKLDPTAIEPIPLHLQPIVEAIVTEARRQQSDETGAWRVYWVEADDPRAAKIEGEIDLVALARAVLFAPTGDNHHNAAACPYCSQR